LAFGLKGLWWRMADITFDLAVRGYSREQVDALVAEVEAALVSADPAMMAVARKRLDEASLGVALRGYHPQQVDRYIAVAQKELAVALGEDVTQAGPEFNVTLRGYDKQQVEAVVRAAAAARSQDPFKLAAVRDMVRHNPFGVTWWGYSREQVDAWVATLLGGSGL
jgi:DivIVA domain-containing protein